MRGNWIILLIEFMSSKFILLRTLQPFLWRIYSWFNMNWNGFDHSHPCRCCDGCELSPAQRNDFISMKYSDRKQRFFHEVTQYILYQSVYLHADWFSFCGEFKYCFIIELPLLTTHLYLLFIDTGRSSWLHFNPHALHKPLARLYTKGNLRYFAYRDFSVFRDGLAHISTTL